MPTKRETKNNPIPPPPPTRKPVYGWQPDLPDHRDYLYGALRRMPAALPAMIDLRKSCSPVEDQSDLGSCTANALAGALEYLMIKDKIPYIDMSRLFIYYNERVIENSVKTDSGAMIRDGIKSLAKQGACSEKNWPYITSKFAAKPTRACYIEGLNHQILAYARINSLDELRACLADGFPVVFGFSVYEGFESPQVAKSGILNMPTSSEKLLGGHAVLAVGYDDAAKRIIVRNSWGTGWGQKGYFTMPYDYVANRNLADDLWTIRRGENM